MNCIPDFGKWIWLWGTVCCSGIILYGFSILDDDWKLCDGEWLWSVWTAVMMNGSIGFLGKVQEATPIEKVCWMAIAIYLIVCTVMDIVLSQINDVLQYLGVLGGAVFLWNRENSPLVGISLILFVMIQYFVFRKLYGKADTMAFSICAMYLAGLGGDTEHYLWHMIISFILMTVVQAFAGNINKRGKLCKPVPMFPYISAGFIFLIQGKF